LRQEGPEDSRDAIGVVSVDGSSHPELRGKIHAGMVLCAVAGRDVMGMKMDPAVEHIEKAGRPVTLTLCLLDVLKPCVDDEGKLQIQAVVDALTEEVRQLRKECEEKEKECAQCRKESNRTQEIAQKKDVDLQSAAAQVKQLLATVAQLEGNAKDVQSTETAAAKEIAELSRMVAKLEGEAKLAHAAQDGTSALAFSLLTPVGCPG
jgi:hypothetical protein